MPTRNKPRVLDSSFYERGALEVAHDLIGKTLMLEHEEGSDRAVIVETEAYVGPEDLACHAAKGRTPRTEVMFGPAGRWYVYFVYGVHWMLNVVTAEEGFPAAVLIRGVEGTTGPGRVAKRFQVDRRFYGAPASERTGLWIEDTGTVIPDRDILRTPRIGVDYAGRWAAEPYRFVVKGSDRAARPNPTSKRRK